MHQKCYAISDRFQDEIQGRAHKSKHETGKRSDDNSGVREARGMMGLIYVWHLGWREMA
jgi:hypothetical protein